MADVKLNTLPQSTSPTSTQDLLLFDESTNAGQRINYNTLADVILAKLTSKTYTVAGGTQTLISAIDALNSKETFNITSSTGTWSSEVTLNDASYAYRLGNIAMIHLNLKIESSTKKNLLITSVLPETMRPRFKVQAVATDGDVDGLCHPVSIEPTGTISFWNSKTGTTYLQTDITYITKNGTL